MPWAAGSYTKGNSGTGGWTGDASLGIGIEAGRHDTQDNDFATGINQCINKDGSNAFTGDPNLGGFKPTNLAAGTAAAPALCVGGDVNTGVFGPAADTWAVATNGVEKLRIDSNGQITTSRGGSGSDVTFTKYESGAQGTTINLQKSKSATIGTNTIVASGDALGEIYFQGANGTSFSNAAAIIAQVDGTPGASNDMPGRLLFSTTADGSGSPTERMRITNDGMVGIGQSSPGTARLSIIGAVSDSTGHVIRCFNSSPTLVFNVRGDGAFSTGVAAASPYNLTTGAAANINVDAGGTLGRSTSSLKYKKDVRDYTRGLDAVNALRPVFYKGINDGDNQFAGLIAEEVHDAGLNEFVVYNDKDEPDALHYGNMVALAFKAIQELNAKVEALEAQVAALTPAPVEEPEE